METFFLKWHNHKIDMLTVFEELLSKEVLVDVTLACEDFSLKAHKMVLSACSPFFQKLFLENPCKHPVIFLKDVPYADLKAIVEFMYKGETFVPQQRMDAFLKTAISLKVIGLSTVKDEHIDIVAEPKNVIQIPDQSENVGSQQTSNNKKQEGRKSPHKSKTTLINHQSLSKTSSSRVPDNENSQTSEEPPHKRSLFKISSISGSQCSLPVIASSHTLVNNEVVMLSRDDQATNEIGKETRTGKDKNSKTEAASILSASLNTANRKTGETASVSSGGGQSTSSSSSLNLSEKNTTTVTQDEAQGETSSAGCKDGELVRISKKPFKRQKPESHSKSVIDQEATVMCEVINIDDNIFVCDVCGRTFPHSGFLRLHKRIHSGEKPWTCEICSETFMQFSHLMQHQSQHKK